MSMSVNLHTVYAKTVSVSASRLSSTDTWTLDLSADGSSVTAFMTAEQLREVYNAIGYAIGFSLPTVLEHLEITQGV